MRLKTGRIYWAACNPPHAYPRLHSDVHCDVAVIGAGVTGTLAAHALSEAGLRVVVVDKRIPATGSTSASTGLLLYDTDQSLAELAREHGTEAAVRCYKLGRRAVAELGRLAALPGIECGFLRKKTLYLASDDDGWMRLRREFKDRKKAGFSCEWFGRRELKARFGFDFPGAIYSRGCAQIDAQALSQGVLARQERRGMLRVFQGTRIVRVTSSGGGVRLVAGNGRRLFAKHVIIATGYETPDVLPPRRINLNVSYVIASQSQPRQALWQEGCLIWETARPYCYLRTTVDRRILIGGEDEVLTRVSRSKARLAEKTRRLRRRFQRFFPKVPFTVEYAWSGTFAESRDGFPFIGAKSDAPRVLYALGYGGNGITFGQIAARLLTRVCLGKAAPDLALFRLDR